MNLKEQMKSRKEFTRKYNYKNIGKAKKSIIKPDIRKSKIVVYIIEFIKSNIKEYTIITLTFLIGVFLGVMFVNNLEETQKNEIVSYINTYVEAFKKSDLNNNVELLQNNIKDNVILVLIIWFIGSTIIGIPIIFGIIAFRGFCLGYTISGLTLVFGVTKGITFTAISIIMQNIIFIPAIISLGVSALKTYKSIYSAQRKENIKLELIRHATFSGLILIFLIVSAVIETQLSTNLLRGLIKYF